MIWFKFSRFLVSIDWQKTYLHIIHDHILDSAVFEVLSQTSNGHTVSTSARGVLDEDVGRSRFNGDAIVTPYHDQPCRLLDEMFM
jgi:hypothetical protein